MASSEQAVETVPPTRTHRDDTRESRRDRDIDLLEHVQLPWRRSMEGTRGPAARMERDRQVRQETQS